MDINNLIGTVLLSILGVILFISCLVILVVILNFLRFYPLYVINLFNQDKKNKLLLKLVTRMPRTRIKSWIHNVSLELLNEIIINHSKVIPRNFVLVYLEHSKSYQDVLIVTEILTTFQISQKTQKKFISYLIEQQWHKLNLDEQSVFYD